MLARLALALVAMLATSGAGPAAERATVVHEVTWFKSGKLAPGLKVTTRLRGFCTSGGAGATSWPYAWKCWGGHWILDSCFSAARRSSTGICPTEPWGNRVWLIHLTEPLPTWERSTEDKGFPWGAWTTNGKHCVAWVGGGTRLTIDGRLVTYLCRGGGALLGRANVRGRVWTIDYSPRTFPPWRHVPLIRVGLTDAWR